MLLLRRTPTSTDVLVAKLLHIVGDADRAYNSNDRCPLSARRFYPSWWAERDQSEVFTERRPGPSSVFVKYEVLVARRLIVLVDFSLIACLLPC